VTPSIPLLIADFPVLSEMEMRKLHMGTVSYGFESMDEIAHQLHVAFGSGNKGKGSLIPRTFC
jgi:hypothetical protein